jgi:hypothetical protein
VCGLLKYKLVTDLDPRLPTFFSEVLRLVTLYERLIHPPAAFRLWLGTLSSRVSPEFGSLSRVHDASANDFPDHCSGLQKWKGAALIFTKNPTASIINEI